MKTFFVVLLLHVCFVLPAQPYQLKKVKNNHSASFRGLSVVDDQIAWLGGSNGWVGISTDGAKSWDFAQIEGMENFSIRSVYAFDGKRALVANAGSPANILLTNDGGKTWKNVYANDNEAAFIDGMDFWNEKEGLVFGDAIDGKMLLLRTGDGGLTWSEPQSRPSLNEGEASFAASGTGIRCTGRQKAIIATGGITSRLWATEDKGGTWGTLVPPIVQGENTTGIYSVAVDGPRIIIVGGDYTKPTVSHHNNLYSTDGGTTWATPEEGVHGYRECVEFISKNTLMATGPTGIDISVDGGNHWQPLSDEEGFHVLRKARKGTLIIVAGNNGQISIVQKEN